MEDIVNTAELNDVNSLPDSIRRVLIDLEWKVGKITDLFLRRSPGVCGFVHLLFEEYFIAHLILDYEQPEILHLIQQAFSQPRWNQAILLALKYLATHSPESTQPLIEKLFSNLENYQPLLKFGEIKIKTSAPEREIIIYRQRDDGSADKWKDMGSQSSRLNFCWRGYS